MVRNSLVTNSRRRWWALVVAFALVLVAGCGGSAEPEPLGNDAQEQSEGSGNSGEEPSEEAESAESPGSAGSSESPGSGVSPGATGEEPPSDPYERELYDATVHFYEVIDRAYRTLNINPVESVVAPGSNAAEGFTSAIEQAKAEDQRWVDSGAAAGYTISGFRVVEEGSQESTAVNCTVRSSPSTLLDNEDEVVERYPAASSKVEIGFQKLGGQWLVSTLSEG